MRPIPAFYCCYLLRSTKSHSSLYVGSTPNPRRRLAQHNGDAKGGAARTARGKLRPWEMTCIVTGFPSSIAALQFEWAWQNSHLTRRIPEDQRITIRTTKFTKGGHRRKRPARPRTSLSDKLSNLHLLLRVSSFARWPLDVRFFSNEVYQAWLRYAGRSNIPIRNGIRILNPQTSGNSEIKDIPVDYAPLKHQLEQSISRLAEGELVCAVCAKFIEAPAAMTVTCHRESCRVVSHMKCLADKFIREEGQGGLVPTTGSCPACKANLLWIDVVKELSLRTRGEKNVAKLMRRPRRLKAKVPESGKLLSSNLTVDTKTNGDLDDDDDDNDDAEDTDEGVCIEDVVDEPLIDEAGPRFEDYGDDMMSVTNAASDVSRPGSPAKAMQTHRLERVIEDSDQDERDMIF